MIGKLNEVTATHSEQITLKVPYGRYRALILSEGRITEMVLTLESPQVTISPTFDSDNSSVIDYRIVGLDGSLLRGQPVTVFAGARSVFQGASGVLDPDWRMNDLAAALGEAGSASVAIRADGNRVRLPSGVTEWSIFSFRIGLVRAVAKPTSRILEVQRHSYAEVVIDTSDGEEWDYVTFREKLPDTNKGAFGLPGPQCPITGDETVLRLTPGTYLLSYLRTGSGAITLSDNKVEITIREGEFEREVDLSNGGGDAE